MTGRAEVNCAGGSPTGMALHSAGSAISWLLIVLFFLSGCTNTIQPAQMPDATRSVYLIDLGRHTRLALELQGGELIEYAYGEWRWYAKMDDQWWRAPAVMLWPTQGALGRWQWPAPDARVRLLEEYERLVVLELPAGAGEVDTLAARLDEDFRRRSSALHRNTTYRLDFVPYDRSYWLFNNSNHAVMEWLQQLGYEVRGSGVLAEWRLAE